MVRGPLGREVEGDLGEVVGDQFAARDVDDRRHRDPLGVVGEAGEVGILEAGDAEDWVDAVGIEVEGPRPLVVGRPGQAERDRRLEAEQPTHDQGAVGPRAGGGRHQSVAACLDRPTAIDGGADGGTVGGAVGSTAGGQRRVVDDAIHDVVGVAVVAAGVVGTDGDHPPTVPSRLAANP